MEWMIHHEPELDVRGFLKFLQSESQKWRQHSFPPEHRTASLQALGVCEEAGELAHAVLKMEQGIRGTRDEHLMEAADAVGDIVIYLAGLSTSLGLDLERCVKSAWAQVAQRNWKDYKETGIEDARASGAAAE
jgi:NTP pyrophosphatase (non-canonical NTP hydrolase)